MFKTFINDFKPTDDLIELLEKKVYKDLRKSKINHDISYNYLAKKYIDVIHIANSKIAE